MTTQRLTSTQVWLRVPLRVPDRPWKMSMALQTRTRTSLSSWKTERTARLPVS